MEFNEVVVKENLGLCRCCLSEGCYKDVCTEYTWMNETEIYAEMLMDCFDISIMQHSDGPNGASRLICEVCITRLRDACNFKKQVQETEKKFIDMISKGEFQPKALQEMKSEVEVEVEPETENTVNAEYLEDEMDFSEAVKEDSDSDYEQPGVSRAATPPKKKRLKKIKIEPPKKGKSDKSGRLRPTPKEKMAAVRANIAEVLLKTTAVPFRWLNTTSRCFYCTDLFYDRDALIKHQEAHTEDDIKKDAIQNYWEGTLPIDVTNLACKLCNKDIDDLNVLVKHLIAKHDSDFDTRLTACLRPCYLKKMSVDCVVCKSSFKTFIQLQVHTKEAHKDTFLANCSICGNKCKCFKSTAHGKKHVNKIVQCSECHESMLLSLMRTHLQKEHGKRYKCFVCNETFKTYYRRATHVRTTHESTNFMIKCTECPKSFLYKSMMSKHFKQMHLKEKNYICAVCGQATFSAWALRDHMLTHDSDSSYSCEICGAAYRNKKRLKIHVGKHCGNM